MKPSELLKRAGGGPRPQYAERYYVRDVIITNDGDGERVWVPLVKSGCPDDQNEVLELLLRHQRM